MSEFKGTPGPWATYRDQLSVGETHGHSGICEVWERHSGEGFENARLIAAAPELLEALEDAVSRIRSNLILLKCDDEFIARETDKARAAIRKALGKESAQ